MEAQIQPGGSGEPETNSPWMFGGHLEPVRLPWSWATARLTEARNYWIATQSIVEFVENRVARNPPLDLLYHRLWQVGDRRDEDADL